MTSDPSESGVVAFAMVEEWGALLPAARVAKELRRRGYRILFLFRPSRFHFRPARGDRGEGANVRDPRLLETHLEQAGFEVREVPVPPLPAGVLERARAYPRWISETLGVARRLLAEARVDLLLLQPSLWFPSCLAALELEIPTVLLSPHFGDFASLEAPPINSSRLPPEDRWSALVNGLDWSWKYLAFQARRKIRPIALLSWLLGPQRAVRRLLRTHRLESRFMGYEIWPDLPMMKIGPRELDFAPGPPRSYLGANVDLERREPAFEWDGIPSAKRLVYCSLGEYADDMPGAEKRSVEEFYSLVLQVAGSRPDDHFVVSTANLDLDRLGTVPPNVTWSRWLPQLQILRRSSAAITSGGFGTVKECLAMGVPLLVVPWVNDQAGNAARVLFHGVGLHADRRRLSAEGLGALLDELLTSEGIRARVEAMRPSLLSEEPLIRGVDLLEEIIRDPSRTRLLTRQAGGGSAAGSRGAS